MGQRMNRRQALMQDLGLLAQFCAMARTRL